VSDPLTLFADNEAALGVAQAERIGASRGLLQAVRAKLQTTERQARIQPRESPGDFTKDYRYLLGFRDALEWVLALPDETRRALGKIKIAAPAADTDIILKSFRGE